MCDVHKKTMFFTTYTNVAFLAGICGAASRTTNKRMTVEILILVHMGLAKLGTLVLLTNSPAETQRLLAIFCMPPRLFPTHSEAATKFMRNWCVGLGIVTSRVWKTCSCRLPTCAVSTSSHLSGSLQYCAIRQQKDAIRRRALTAASPNW
jgi:hypothetical protein